MIEHELPLVSVITPVFNLGRTISRTIASVRTQTYPRVEHIVVDGGSTDETLEVLKSEPGIRWISEPDEGQSQAINKGISMSNGLVLTWLNADDWLEPDSITATIEVFKESPDVGWVYGDLVVRRSEGLLIARPPFPLELAHFENGNVIPQPGTFFSREAFEKVGALDESLHLVMDFDLWLRLLMAGVKPGHVARPVASFVIHSDSKTGSLPSSDFSLEELRVFLKHDMAEEAALAAGRAAARELTDRRTPTRQAVEDAIQRLLMANDKRLNEKWVRAGAYTELAISPQARRVSSLRYLLRKQPWEFGPTRRRLFWALRRAILKLLRHVTKGRSGSIVPLR